MRSLVRTFFGFALVTLGCTAPARPTTTPQPAHPNSGTTAVAGSPTTAGGMDSRENEAGSGGRLEITDAGAARVDASIMDAGSGSGVTKAAAEPALANPSFVFSPYKDTNIDLNWNSNVITTKVSGTATSLVSDLTRIGGRNITLAFATGECGSENWGGLAGAMLASANVNALQEAGVRYVIATGGAAGAFTCTTDAGMKTFIERWRSPSLIGVDFDIEAGQSQSDIAALIARIKYAHEAYPALRFSLTLATFASSAEGSDSARPLGAAATNNLNAIGTQSLELVRKLLGWTDTSTWPKYLTINLMTMDYGSPTAGMCVVRNGACHMGQSALQAAYNLRDFWKVPMSAIELTPMIARNDVRAEEFTLADIDTVVQFARAQGLAGLHYWSYDRDRDCTSDSASATCNSVGTTGTRGYIKRFLSALEH